MVLVEPEIPQNTGNIARTCAATGCELHLVRPLGFAVTDRHLKRSGLDYWKDVSVVYHNSWAEFLDKTMARRLWLASARAPQPLSQVTMASGDWLVFGCESRGLPGDVLTAFPQQTFHIPMKANSRSLNLANAVAIVVFEGFRQIGYQGLS